MIVMKREKYIAGDEESELTEEEKTNKEFENN